MSDLNKTIRATDIELKDRLVAINRVTKVTKGGRHFSFSAIVVVGDEKNIVGHGLGKANEVTEAIQKAVEDAKKNDESNSIEFLKFYTFFLSPLLSIF